MEFCPAAPTPLAASGAKFPVKGVVPELSNKLPVLVTPVLVKLTPLPLVGLLARFNILPLGARRFIYKSDTSVWATLNVTDTLEITAPAGMPAIARLLVTPIALLLGIARFIVPED